MGEEASLICRDQQYDRYLVNLLKESSVETFAKKAGAESKEMVLSAFLQTFFEKTSLYISSTDLWDGSWHQWL